MGKLNKVATIERVAKQAGIAGARYNLQASRHKLIYDLYQATGGRRERIHRNEILCVTGWSGSTFDNRIKASKTPRHDLYGAEHKLTETEKRNRVGDRRAYHLYDLDKFDKWLKREDEQKWREVHALRKSPPAKVPTLAQTKTLDQAETVLLLGLRNLKGEVVIFGNHLDTLIREAEAGKAGKMLGLMTLADAMTKYTWSSAKRREQARRVWVRILDQEQKRIDNYRELDGKRAAEAARADLERTLPKGRHSGRRPKPL